MLEYSRDSLVGLLRTLEQARDSIRHGRFDPDMTRSGRWRKGGPSTWGTTVDASATALAGEALPQPSSAEAPVAAVESDPEEVVKVFGVGFGAEHAMSLSSNYPDSDDDVPWEVADLPVIADLRPGPTELTPAFPEGGLFRHHKSLCLHVGKLDDCTSLRCGKPVSENLHQLDDWPSIAPPRCSICFRAVFY